MAKRVFFSFHYEDVITFRANVVRNHSLTKGNGAAGFFDASIWEDAERHGDASVKRLINSNLENTTVTCVLIGSETWNRKWVRYEIMKSYERGNSLLGVHINSIADKNRQTFVQGYNPFKYLGFYIDSNGRLNNYQEYIGDNWQIFEGLSPRSRSFDRQYWNRWYSLSDWVHCYDWILDNGYNNFSNWLENAT